MNFTNPKAQRRKRMLLPPCGQRQARPLPPVTKTLAALYRGCRQAPIVYAALGQLAQDRKTLRVFASRAQIAQVAGLITKQFKNVSKATRALHEAGFVQSQSVRLGKPSGAIVELLEFWIQSGALRLLPLAPLRSRLMLREVKLPPQLPLAQVASKEPSAVVAWLGLAILANQSGKLTVEFHKSNLTQVTGIQDSSGERLGRVLGVLAAAGWLKIAQKSGRRGNRVVPWRVRLIIGTTTAAFAPVDVLSADAKMQPVSRVKQQFPTSAICTHEPLRGRKAFTSRSRAKSTSTTRKESKRVAKGDALGPIQISGTKPAQRLAVPTSQPQLMRPHLLDHPIAALYAQTSDPQIHAAHIAKLRRLEDELKRQIDPIVAIRSSTHVDHRFYRRHQARWDGFHDCLVDWVQETGDWIQTLQALGAIVFPGEVGRSSEKSTYRKLRALAAKLLGTGSNRSFRQVYRFGPSLLRAASTCTEDARKALQRMAHEMVLPTDHDRSPTPALDFPRVAPRYLDIDMSGYARDTLLNKFHRVSEGTFDGKFYGYSWAVVEAGCTEIEDYQLDFRIRALRQLSMRAFKAIRRAFDLNVFYPEGEEDHALSWYLGRLNAKPELALIPAMVRLDTRLPQLNLSNGAPPYKLFLAARREYAEAGVLGLVMAGSDRRLWILHDDNMDPPQAERVTRKLDSKEFRLEPFEAFLKSPLARDFLSPWGDNPSQDLFGPDEREFAPQNAALRIF